MKVMLVLSASFLLVTAEDSLAKFIPFSGLLGVMAVRATLVDAELAKRLNDKFAKIWSAAEIFLFVLVGSAVDISALGGVSFAAVALIFGALVFRMVAVFLAISGTNLNTKERISQRWRIRRKPPSTAIGSIPLAAGVEAGKHHFKRGRFGDHP